MSKPQRPLFRRKLIAASIAFTIAGLTPFISWADPYTYETYNPTYLAVATAGDMVGVCNGDRQGLATAESGEVETNIVTHSVGTDIPRNRETMTGFDDLHLVISAENSYRLASLYHFYVDEALQDELHTESFSWAVQHYLEVFGRMHSLIPTDGGTLSEEMLAKANTYAGPYYLPAIWEGKSTPAEPYLKIANLGVQAQSGAWFPGAKLTLELNGPASFVALPEESGELTETSLQKLELETTETAQTVPVQVTGSGEIEVTIHVSGLPSPVIQILEMEHYQDLITVPAKKSEISKTIQTTAGKQPVSLEIKTAVTQAVLRPDDPVIDQIWINATQWPRDYAGNPLEVNIRATLYGPFTTAPTPTETLFEANEETANTKDARPKQNGAVPPGITPVSSQLLTVKAAGQYQSDPTQVPTLEPGFYTWVVEAKYADQSDPTVLETETGHGFGVAEETFQVITANQPPPEETSTGSLPPPKYTKPRLPETGPATLISLTISTASFGSGLLILRPRKKETQL
ncbi:LPXTG cell wall anchor domain-containing protein [Gleimia sp. 6138-11-ORH1]|uniref:LPXTG cell wall anchor domain-containing protein n=1 Tax=Gleimia sp. 6138-11-ORH1 TaxID=2973937 RepID=UPI00216715D8|nr:LPXTG cell wall anchor domain-containing protein [Gleimia sp. 6138-11-ORH1]MCS4484918.1 LPXTG cell wall anchor domain-containing protein [Gleimia sp. 6138-11-ORH1]